MSVYQAFITPLPASYLHGPPVAPYSAPRELRPLWASPFPSQATLEASPSPEPAPPPAQPKEKQQRAEKHALDGTELPGLPEKVLERLLYWISMPHLPSIVRLSSTCVALRLEIGQLAPWRAPLEALAAEPAPAPGAQKERRRADRVDPKDLRRKKGDVNCWKVLAKYGPRLCLGCLDLFPMKTDILPLSAPAYLLDLVAAPFDPHSELLFGMDEADPQAPSRLCAGCRADLWKHALACAGGQVEAVSTCAGALARARGESTNKGRSEKAYVLRGRLDGLPFRAVTFRSVRSEHEMTQHLYAVEDVLLRAWQVHGGPWGLAAMQEKSRVTKEKRAGSKRKRAVEGGESSEEVE
ncbi:hypothetical protein DFJ74DRAFT_705713 [Hyaloraphidium curvatum]|nr:hypothetical protein DFJ74DRAFT_705713 [Hyaloraphidium curvatum]